MIQSRLITGIMACDEQGMIGKGRGVTAGLPWNCPDDTEHFRRTTCGHVMIMGQATYDCLPQTLLPDRICIVLSHHAHESTETVIFVNSIDKLPAVLKQVPHDKNIFMIGGSNMAQQFFQRNILDRFLLSRIKGVYNGTCRFDPAFLAGVTAWPCINSQPGDGFILNTYVNPQPDNLAE